jgi:putative endonuclease
VYIIESAVDGSYYKGFSENPVLRLTRHNNGETRSTKNLLPWKLVYIEELPSKREALIRERNLKKASRERIQALLIHPKNVLSQFL